MNRKKFSSTRALLVLTMTILVFSVGILLGSTLNSKKVDMVRELNNELYLKTLSVEVNFEILQDKICDSERVLDLASELHDVAEKAEYMENALGYDDPKIEELKKYYFILETKHWLLSKERYEQCGDMFNATHPLDRTSILYFYSNEGDCPRCDQQGTVLSYTKELFPGLMVYSYDRNADSPVVRTLIDVYDVGTAPTIVINDYVHEGFLDVDDLVYLAENISSSNES